MLNLVGKDQKNKTSKMHHVTDILPFTLSKKTILPNPPSFFGILFLGTKLHLSILKAVPFWFFEELKCYWKCCGSPFSTFLAVKAQFEWTLNIFAKSASRYLRKEKTLSEKTLRVWQWWIPPCPFICCAGELSKPSHLLTLPTLTSTPSFTCQGETVSKTKC